MLSVEGLRSTIRWCWWRCSRTAVKQRSRKSLKPFSTKITHRSNTSVRAWRLWRSPESHRDVQGSWTHSQQVDSGTDCRKSQL